MSRLICMQLHKVLHILLSSVQQEIGVKIKIDEQDNIFRGSIGPFASDNLGAHSIGGFIEGFNALRVCRVCMGTNNDIKTKVYILL